jgi:hypothetical protein
MSCESDAIHQSQVAAFPIRPQDLHLLRKPHLREQHLDF